MFPKNTTQKIIPISTQKYEYGGVMKKSVLDLTFKTRTQKKGSTTTEVNDIYGNVFLKLCGLNIWNKFLNTQLPLNEDDNNIFEQLNDINYKRTSSKLHDAGWKNSYFISDCVYMISYGCGMSQYPQFYDQDFDKYQVLPCLYLGSFEGFSAETIIEENGC